MVYDRWRKKEKGRNRDGTIDGSERKKREETEMARTIDGERKKGEGRKKKEGKKEKKGWEMGIQ